MKFNTVIVGAGHAGGMIAISLRNKKYKGSIAIIGQESFFPYQRPPLSKVFLNNDIDVNKLYLKSENFYIKNNIDIILNKKVNSITKKEKFLLLDTKEKIHYDTLVFATGSLINKLNTKVDNLTTHYLRDIEDAKKLKHAIKNIDDLVIIGAGYIGLEVAASLKNNNLKITVIDMDDRVMSSAIEKYLSEFFYNKHISEGVNFLFNQNVASIKNHNGRSLIKLSDGSVLKSDVILVGIGVKPNIKLAKQIGLICDDGIKVDEYGQTSEKDIYATGDCASHYNPILNTQLRLESVQNCVELSNTIAFKICGESRPYSKVPWFWSDQYNIKLQIAGSLVTYDKSLMRGDPEKEKFSIFYQKDNQLISVHCINSPKDFLLGKKLIANQKKFNLDLLENPDLKFSDIV